MTLTDAAAERIRQIMARADKPVAGLRIGVKNGGCAGMEYTMDWAGEAGRSTRRSRTRGSPC
jgi:iron-sulfur cluster assembly protein